MKIVAKSLYSYNKFWLGRFKTRKEKVEFGFNHQLQISMTSFFIFVTTLIAYFVIALSTSFSVGALIFLFGGVQLVGTVFKNGLNSREFFSIRERERAEEEARWIKERTERLKRQLEEQMRYQAERDRIRAEAERVRREAERIRTEAERKREREQKYREYFNQQRQYSGNRTNTTSRSHPIEGYLKVLELPLDTRDLRIIKKQYRTLMKKHHPDANGGRDEKAKQIIGAYEAIEKMLG